MHGVITMGALSRPAERALPRAPFGPHHISFVDIEAVIIVEYVVDIVFMVHETAISVEYVVVIVLISGSHDCYCIYLFQCW